MTEWKPFNFQIGGSSLIRRGSQEEISNLWELQGKKWECVCSRGRGREHRFEQEAVKQGTGQRLKGGNGGVVSPHSLTVYREHRVWQSRSFERVGGGQRKEWLFTQTFSLPVSEFLSNTSTKLLSDYKHGFFFQLKVKKLFAFFPFLTAALFYSRQVQAERYCRTDTILMLLHICFWTSETF